MNNINNKSIGESWNDFKTEVFSPEEIAESNFRVALIEQIIHARKSKNISQKQLEELSGVKQPVIARLETGSTSPQVDTLLKILMPLGMTLSVTPIDQ